MHEELSKWGFEYTAVYGLSIFPVGGKTPILKGSWKEYSSSDPVEAENLLTQADVRATGLALDCGKSKIMVIDADKHKVDGPANLKMICQEIGLDLEKTWSQRTGGGGFQYFFSDPFGEASNSANADLGIDVRGVGGYVAIPPSIHPATKNTYIWIKGPGSQPIAIVDDRVRKLLERIQSASKIKTVLTGQTFQKCGEIILSSGERNDKLFRLACSERDAGKGFDSILASLRGFNQHQVQPPLSDSELQRIANQAAKYAVKSAKAAADFLHVPDGRLLINLADVEPEKVDWLWYPYIPKGKITTVQGDPGSGKTFLMAKIAALVSTGEPFPGQLQPRREPGMVIYQNGEDGLADTIVPRVIACNADRSKITKISEDQQQLTLVKLDWIEAAFKECKPELFVIDPIQLYLGADKDMHRANEVRPVLAGIANLCERYGTACVIVMHMNKGDGKAMYRALGSIDFAAIARSQLLVGKDRNNSGQNLIIHTKSSLAPAGLSMAFQIKGDDGLDFLGENCATADDVLKDPPAVKTDSTLGSAYELIRSEVANAPIWTSDLEEKALEKGVGLRTLDRARKELKDCGEIQVCMAPGIRRWYIKRRGEKISFSDTAPAYENPE